MIARHGMRLFYLPMVELRHILCRHMVNEYEGHALYSSLILWLKLHPLPYSLCTNLPSHNWIHINVHIKALHIKFITLLHFPYQRGILGLPYNANKKLTLTSLRFDMMLFHPINLKSIINLLWRIPLRLPTSTFINLPLDSSFHIKDPLNFI